MSGRRWTPAERELALAHLTAWRIETIARRLGRAPEAVRRWLERHGQFPTTQDRITSGWAARLTGRSPQWLTAQARAGRIPARRVPGGRWWLFDPERLPGARWPGDLRRLP